jgi:polyhydroxyalkanoate synthesis regulator phasin
MEQMMSKEQEWIIECAQVGLKAVQYYAEAAGIAAQNLDEVGNEFLGNWEQVNSQQARKYLKEMIISAKYISKATAYQKKSFDGLASGIKVSTQVTEQLSTNSTKTFKSATVMEEVVEQLRKVVGSSTNYRVGEEGLKKEREMATVTKN